MSVAKLRLIYFYLAILEIVYTQTTSRTSSTAECIRCISKDLTWCPYDDSYRLGQCFSERSNRQGFVNLARYWNSRENRYTHPGLQHRDLCSDKVKKVSAKFRNNIMQYSCPYDSNLCGSDMSLIVAPYSEQRVNFKLKTKDKRGNPQFFVKNDLCKHKVLFPLDAHYGDKIRIQVTNLQNIQITVGLGKEWKSQGMVGGKFSKSVNAYKNGGIADVPYPNEIYIVITHVEDYYLQTNYDFSIKFRKKQKIFDDGTEIDIADKSDEDSGTREQKVQIINGEEIKEIIVENENKTMLVTIISFVSLLMMFIMFAVLMMVFRQVQINEQKDKEIKLMLNNKTTNNIIISAPNIDARQRKQSQVMRMKGASQEVIFEEMKQYFYESQKKENLKEQIELPQLELDKINSPFQMGMPIETERDSNASPDPIPPENNAYTYNSIKPDNKVSKNSRKDSKRDYKPDIFDNMIHSKEFQPYVEDFKISPRIIQTNLITDEHIKKQDNGLITKSGLKHIDEDIKLDDSEDINLTRNRASPKRGTGESPDLARGSHDSFFESNLFRREVPPINNFALNVQEDTKDATSTLGPSSPQHRAIAPSRPNSIQWTSPVRKSTPQQNDSLSLNDLEDY